MNCKRLCMANGDEYDSVDMEIGEVNNDMDELLTISQVARALKVSRQRVVDYVNQGKITCVYTPPISRRKFRVSDVNKFIASL